MKKIGVQLTVAFYKEGNKFIAYCPAFDISTYGDSFEDAKRKFEELTDLFIDETMRMGTLDEVLTGLGWKKVIRPKPRWIPPVQQIATVPEMFQIPIPA